MDMCYLCQSTKKDDIKYGEFLQNEKMGVHLFCLYLSSNLAQNGEDDEGFLGFLPKDIAAEKRRVSLLKCYYCHLPYANVGCCEKKCQHAFHFICGLEKGAQNQFCGSYKSYCHRHIRKWLNGNPKTAACLICYDNLVGPKERYSVVNVIRAPCCRNGWFHKFCLQKFAINSGYFFKCPLCNDAKIFRQQLPVRGIYIPNKDAAWELEPNAFAELLERPNHCSAVQCENKEGRNNTTPNNPLIFCSTCGSTAMHKSCLPHRGNRFHCADCTIAMEERDSGRESFNSPNNNDDADIDVCNVSDQEDMELIRGLLPDNKPECELDADNSSSDDEEITTSLRNKTAILDSNSSDSDCCDTSKENRNPSAKRNIGKSRRKEIPKEQTRDITKDLNTASNTQKGITNRRQRRILHAIEDDDVEIVKNDDTVSDDSDDNDEKCRTKIKRYKKVNKRVHHSEAEEEIGCTLKINRKRALIIIDSDSDDKNVPEQIHSKQVQTRSVTVIPIDDDTTDEDAATSNEFSNRDSVITVQTSSDQESNYDSDPLENFTKLVEKAKSRSFVAQRTRLKSVYSDNPREQLFSQPSVSSNGNTNKPPRATVQSKALRFGCSPQKDYKKKTNLDVSCIAKRTRRQSMCCVRNTLNASNAGFISRGRRKTVCSETTTEKQKQQRNGKEYESDVDTDNYVVSDVDSKKNNGKLNRFEISCIANRTRNRRTPNFQIIDEETSSSYESVSSASSSSYHSAASHIPVTSSQESAASHQLRYSEKWPKQDVDSAYINKGKSRSKKPYPSNPYRPHYNNRRRI